jgi:hypothetical protein
MKREIILISVIACIIVIFGAVSCKHDPIPPVIPENTVYPPPGTDGICFSDQILPLIQSYCAYTGCHDGNSEPMNLTTYNDIMQVVQAGNANNSALYNAIIGGEEEPMPPSGKPQLTTAQVVLIHNWIQQGALNNVCSCDSTIFTFSGAVWPTIQGSCIGCHSGSTPSGNPPLNLSTYSLIFAAVNSQNLYGRITGSTGAVMPPGNKMSDCKILQIHKWIIGGMPNN